MRRRNFLAAVSISAIAGCSDQSQSNGGGELAIETSSLLTHYDGFGDVLSNQVSAVSVGGNAMIGVRYTIPAHDGEIQEVFQTTIYHDDSSVDSRSESDTKLVGEGVGAKNYERWFAFDTEGWDQGSYTAETIVRDSITENNQSVTLDFDVSQPLSPDEIELVEISKPPELTVGQSDSFDFEFNNVSDRDGSIVSTLSGRYEGSRWTTVSNEKVRMNLSAGETRTYEASEVTFPQAGTYEYRLDDIDVSWTVTVADQ